MEQTQPELLSQSLGVLIFPTPNLWFKIASGVIQAAGGNLILARDEVGSVIKLPAFRTICLDLQGNDHASHCGSEFLKRTYQFWIVGAIAV